MRVDSSEKDVEYDDQGVPSIYRAAKTQLRLFGTGFTENMQVAFTDKKGNYRDFCEFPKTDPYTVS